MAFRAAFELHRKYRVQVKRRTVDRTFVFGLFQMFGAFDRFHFDVEFVPSSAFRNSNPESLPCLSVITQIAAEKSIDGGRKSGLDGRMKTKRIILSLCVALVPMTLAFAAGADEKAVRDADEEWSKVAGAKDLDKTVAFYADDAIVMPPNEAAVTTKDGIRNLWKGFLDSLQDISWKTTRVAVARSRDMAILIGTYEMTMKDGNKDKGKYCEVWEKKADGKWKVGTDMFSSDLPAQSAASPVPGAAEKK
jgi:ketosteroid isomerase-like protein